MTNLNVETNELSIDDLSKVVGGADYEFHFSLFGYFFAVQGNDKMDNTLVVGPGHKVLVNNTVLKG